MRILSVNTGLAKKHSFGSTTVRTSIVKEPVDGAVFLSKTGLTGDGLATPVYGGHRRAALYAYPVEHYEHWQKVTGRESLPYGKLGENITTEGLLESETWAGDIFRIGEATVQAVGFRIPCRNLGLTMDDSSFVLKFRKANLPGIFFTVLEEGEIEKGNEITLLQRPDQSFTIEEMTELYYQPEADRKKISKLLSKDFLPGIVKKDFQTKIASGEEA